MIFVADSASSGGSSLAASPARSENADSLPFVFKYRLCEALDKRNRAMEEQDILAQEFSTLLSHYQQEEKLLIAFLSEPAEANISSRSRCALAGLELARVRHRISLVRLASSPRLSLAQFRRQRKLFAKGAIVSDSIDFNPFLSSSLPQADEPSFLQQVDEDERGGFSVEDVDEDDFL